MDPNACLERFLIAVEEGDLREAEQHHENLTNWLARGGFAPDWADHEFELNGEVIDVTEEWFKSWSPGVRSDDLDQVHTSLEALNDALKAKRDHLVGDQALGKLRMSLTRTIEHLSNAIAELEAM